MHYARININLQTTSTVKITLKTKRFRAREVVRSLSLNENRVENREKRSAKRLEQARSRVNCRISVTALA